MKSARPWRYSSALAFDESHSVPANESKQHYTVIPESIYHSMKLHCECCHEEFWFSANEQKIWYEDWGFWVDSVPKHCAKCRKLVRDQHGRA